MKEAAMPATDEKQNITVRLSKQTIQKARVLAARRSTSISSLLASQIEELATKEDAYDLAMKRAIARMKKGFHLGGDHKIDREELHDRDSFR
jgi:Arc/MetJ family transcription regulator